MKTYINRAFNLIYNYYFKNFTQTANINKVIMYW